MNNQESKTNKTPKKQRKKLTAKKLILTSVILLASTYAYLWLCGLVFDMWLNMPESVLFIFYSFFTLLAADIVVIIYLIVRYIIDRRK